jgi:hypothetical protein
MNIGAAERFYNGTYISGFSSIVDSIDDVECDVTDTDLVFLDGEGYKLGEIPRTAVLQVSVQGLTSPEDRKDHTNRLSIRWTDINDERLTVFEFYGTQASDDARNAADAIRRARPVAVAK